ncbi:MAG: hypothetical protein KGI06_02075 [Candidatus Micrarchaeota archaeon]|nr:hypothetical protein [Candidatus Micrarchaeota archaeon]
MAKSQKTSQRNRTNPVLYILAGIGAIVVIALALSLVSETAKLIVISSVSQLSGAESLAAAVIGGVVSLEFLVAVIVIFALVIIAVRQLRKS